MSHILIFILGLFFGSFGGVIVHRLHTGEKGIFTGRSHCPKCNHRLGFWDLFPLLSFVASGGKCRYCKTRISLFYPTVELFTGGLLLLTSLLLRGGSLAETHLIFYLVVSFIFVLLILYDLLFQEVPDEVSLPGVALIVIYTLVEGLHPWRSLLLGMAVPVVFFGAQFIFSKGKWLGGGDVRVGALMGALLGWPHILAGLFLGYASGALFSVIGILSGKIGRKSHIPFVPFLLLGTYLTLFWGDQILDWYLKLL